MDKQTKWMLAILIVVLIGMVAGGIYLYNDLFPKAKPMQTPETVVSVTLHTDTNGTPIPMDHQDWETLCDHIRHAKPTRIQAWNDNPTVRPYYGIEIQAADRPYRYFIYEDDNQIYVEIPYEGIYETNLDILAFVQAYFQEE